MSAAWSKAAPRGPARPRAPARPLASARWPLAAGLVAAAVASCAALVLALQHVGAIDVPGCGRGGACARAAAGAFGSVPWLAWPTSFVGAAFFPAAAAVWLALGGRPTRAVLWIERLALAASLVFVVEMLVMGWICPWCLAVHGANLVLWIAVERGARGAPGAGSGAARGARPLVVGAALFAVASVALGVVRARAEAAHATRGEEDLAGSTAALVAAARNLPAAPTGADGRPLALAGRWRRGPERARARIVVFSDYQCPDCVRVERQLERLLARHDDVSVTMRHSPMSAQCNPAMQGEDPHPNACWAARAAEAAGRLGGEQGFWRMHAWLFEREGTFTRTELEREAARQGFDPQAFTSALESAEVFEPIALDLAQSAALGLQFTPMVFINGIELRGVFAEAAVERAVEEVLAANPALAGPEGDRPAAAHEKLVDDWRAQERVALPPGLPGRAIGAGTVEVVLWADYWDERTASIDAALRRRAAERGDVRYAFRHFPFERACNPIVTGDGHPGVCASARAAEAAYLLGGQVAWTKVHAALMENAAAGRPPPDVERLLALCEAAGLERELVRTTLADARVAAAIRADADAGLARLYRGGIPTLYVDGRVVPRWQQDGQSAIDAIVDAALAERR